MFSKQATCQCASIFNCGHRYYLALIELSGKFRAQNSFTESESNTNNIAKNPYKNENKDDVATNGI